jgi:UDP-2,3-diacylglucosamine hydrolase
MPVAVVADAHLGGPGGEAGPLVRQLDALLDQDCDRLVLLGDIFHVWVGDRRYETAEVRAVAAAIERLRAGGLPVDYVEGNRDFFLDRGPYASLFDRLAAEVTFEAAGIRYLAVHGDGLNDRDWQYRFWRWLSKSLPCRLAVLNMPNRLAQRFVTSTEARLGRTNFKHKRRVPKEVIRAYGARRLREGHDVLLLGHFHAPHAWPTGSGEVRVLDAWFNSRRVEWFGRPPLAETGAI